jgi:hypothetical protein
MSTSTTAIDKLRRSIAVRSAGLLQLHVLKAVIGVLFSAINAP